MTLDIGTFVHILEALVAFGAIIGVYVGMKVQVTRLEVVQQKLEEDVDNLGDLYRELIAEIRNAKK